jgi:uncharacterized protein
MLGQHERLALISCLAEGSPSHYIGRTALMKYMYFLQTLRNVPLGYRFTLYAYGPFDSEVLSDLSRAESMNAVSSEAVLYPGGYGYEIRSASGNEWLRERASGFIRKHKTDIDWVIRSFGTLTSAQLELASTIIFVDREAALAKEKLDLNAITKRVQEVKPHFSIQQILLLAERLANEKLLQSLR